MTKDILVTIGAITIVILIVMFALILLGFGIGLVLKIVKWVVNL